MAEVPAEKYDATPAKQTEKPVAPAVDEDSDPDFDDLDDVLDQFSSNTAAPKEASKPTPTASGPGRPEDVASSKSPPLPEGQKPGETEEQFMTRLTSEMQNMMTQLSTDPAASSSSPEDLAKMGKELDDLTRKLEAEGIQPQDLLKAILGEETGAQVAKDAENERDRRESQSQSRSPEKSRSDAQASGSNPSKTTFDETIRRTMNKLSTSDQQATQQTNQPKSEEDMLAELLKAMDSGDGGSEGDLSKMFLGMMEQLTHKDMLYEPMKELNEKYPDWLAANKSKVSAEDAKRFSTQQVIVKEIVDKFEEKGYSDDDPSCREYIWERMQKMQTEGSPPEDLIANPFPGMGGMPDLGGGGGPPGEDPGCPTQ